MSVTYNTSIVRDGLVLYLDTVNPKSYSGSGNNWYDLSGNNYHMSLKNSPTFTKNQSISYFSFNGINQYGACDGTVPDSKIASVTNLNFQNTNPKTVICFANIETTQNGYDGGLFSIGDGGVYGQEFGLRLVYGSSIDFRAQMWGTPDYDFPYDGTEKWTMYTMLYGADKIGKTYANDGILLGQDETTFDLVTAGSTPFEAGRWITFGQYITAKISNYLVYDKALTVSEISQNFNALKGRYGL